MNKEQIKSVLKSQMEYDKHEDFYWSTDLDSLSDKIIDLEQPEEKEHFCILCNEKIEKISNESYKKTKSEIDKIVKEAKEVRKAQDKGTLFIQGKSGKKYKV